jgi:nucleotidyltransferase substrate binding protein (TIGR01987 family)
MTMSEDRFELCREHFGKAVDALTHALAQPEDEFVRDSIIKRFELCFETARKAMQRWLQEQGELSSQDTKRAVLQAALRTGLIADPDLWNELGVARNDTSHEYDQGKAVAIAALVRERGLPAFEALRAQLAVR